MTRVDSLLLSPLSCHASWQASPRRSPNRRGSPLGALTVPAAETEFPSTPFNPRRKGLGGLPGGRLSPALPRCVGLRASRVRSRTARRASRSVPAQGVKPPRPPAGFHRPGGSATHPAPPPSLIWSAIGARESRARLCGFCAGTLSDEGRNGPCGRDENPRCDWISPPHV